MLVPQVLEESVQGIESGLLNYRCTTKDVALALFAEEEGRYKDLTQVRVYFNEIVCWSERTIEIVIAC